MHIYLAGIGGVGIGPLAEIASGAGYEVSGSDQTPSLMTQELTASGIDVIIYPQDGSRMRQLHAKHAIDWFVYTSSLPENHAELVLARELGIRTSKRDELLSHIIEERQLKLIAVAGTHGKTTTTGMLVWALQQLGIPVSYSIGTTVRFGPSGLFDEASEYFVYECDEYDKNFLAFRPYVALITAIDHDHFDTYPTLESYDAAFRQFAAQSRVVVTWRENEDALGHAAARYLTHTDPALTLPGTHNRRNASLGLVGLADLFALNHDDLIAAFNSFPGTDRRFEKLADNLYTDYGHHPAEISATLQMASELGKRVVLVYQPHQNGRQYEVRDQYTADVFSHADHVYWLPTYLTRENASQVVLTPQELSQAITEKTKIAGLDDTLWAAISREISEGSLVLCMGAGPIDGWLRERLTADPDHSNHSG